MARSFAKRVDQAGGLARARDIFTFFSFSPWCVGGGPAPQPSASRAAAAASQASSASSSRRASSARRRPSSANLDPPSA